MITCVHISLSLEMVSVRGARSCILFVLQSCSRQRFVKLQVLAINTATSGGPTPVEGRHEGTLGRLLSEGGQSLNHVTQQRERG